jgi:hypothetical protein
MLPVSTGLNLKSSCARPKPGTTTSTGTTSQKLPRKPSITTLMRFTKTTRMVVETSLEEMLETLDRKSCVEQSLTIRLNAKEIGILLPSGAAPLLARTTLICLLREISCPKSVTI